ncbi:MAG: hypothetical protein ACI9GW_001538, partial [Halieaceae bacterium]
MSAVHFLTELRLQKNVVARDRITWPSHGAAARWRHVSAVHFLTELRLQK